MALRVPLDQKPKLAAGAMEPPFFLDAQLIGAHVKIVGPLNIAHVQWILRPGVVFPPKTEFLAIPRTTVWAINPYHHLSPGTMTADRRPLTANGQSLMTNRSGAFFADQVILMKTSQTKGLE